MDIKYTILEFNQNTGSILVNYFCNEVPEGITYNLDIPIENGQFPTQESLAVYVDFMKPTGQLERITALKNITAPQYLLDKIPAPVVAPIPTADQPIIVGVDPLPGV